MPKNKKSEGIELNKVRAMIRKKIDERWGSMSAFLRSEESEKFGGSKIRCYLYDTGAVNFKVIASLCEYFGLGTLSRKIIITKVSVYNLEKSSSKVSE